MKFWEIFKFNPEVFATKTFVYSAVSYAGVWTMFANGEVGWKFVLGTTAAFIILTCFRDGGISVKKTVETSCPPPAEEASLNSINELSK